MKNKGKLLPYLLWSFGIGWALQVMASLFASKGNYAVFRLFLLITMFAPFAAVLLSGADVKALGWRPHIKKNWKVILLACILPMALTAMGAALYYTVVPAAFDMSGSYIISTAGETAVAQLEEQGLTVPLYGILSALEAMTLTPFINMIPALGEETGWRGVMYPELKKRFGTVKGRIIGGVIWGAWHWPVMLLAGYEYGTDYWGAPVSGMAAFCIFSAAFGIMMDWFYEKTDCIWLPALAHGAINAAGTVPLIFLNSACAGSLLLGPAPNGVVAGLPMIAAAAIISIGRRFYRHEGD